jgi:hypothetical protein
MYNIYKIGAKFAKRGINNYNNTISTLNRNQLLMKTNLNNFQDKVNKVFEDVAAFTRARNIIEQILLNCQTLIRFLDNLENAIMFSKINTLHNSIISTSDLKKMLETLSKLYDQNRIPTFKNFISYYQIANTKVSFYDNRIIFSIYIPLLNTINFDYYHLYPIPQANHIILPPKTLPNIQSKNLSIRRQRMSKCRRNLFLR